MSEWKPKPAPGVKVMSLPLSMEAGFVFSRLDGHTRVAELATLTGFSAEVIQGALRQLLEHGALVSEGAPLELLPAPPVSATEPEAESLSPEGGDPETEGDAEAEGDDEADDQDDAGEPDPELTRGNFRAIYEQRFRSRSASERVAAAKDGAAEVLSALCLDPLTEVIRAVLDHPNVGPTQARLIAQHHHSSIGIGMLLGRAEFARDAQVRHLLLRNPQLNEPLLGKLYAGRRLKDLYAAARSHEITDQVRRAARNLLRQRFVASAPEEKFEVIWASEGRVLAVLIGVALDGKTVQLFTERVFTSVLLIQNFARWPASTQTLLRHLLSQQMVTRSVPLKNMVKRHPNAPKDR